jgi:hypothetical protein
MTAQTFIGTLDGVDVVIIESTDAAELERIAEQFTASGNDVLMVLGWSDQATDEEIIAAFEATLPLVDTFVLYHPANQTVIEWNDPLTEPDAEPDAIYDLPRIVQSQIHLDVPYEFVAAWRDALRKAWQQSQPGSLVIIAGGQSVDQTLSDLRQISQTTEHLNEKARPRAVELDQDAIETTSNSGMV